MKFYRIRHNHNIKETGKYPQIKDVTYPSTYDSPKSINTARFTKIEFEPEVPRPILDSKAKKTDLIEEIPSAPFNILISEKLKSILEANRKDGIQFFRGSVLHDGLEDKGYWFLNIYVFNNEYIDYKNSLVNWEKKADDFEKTYSVTSVELNLSKDDFTAAKEKAREKLEAFYIKNLFLQDVKEDFFGLNVVEGGVGYFISEKLKKEIEDAGCTGIEFQPSELSYNEWTAPEGERQRVYGKSW